jgi:hypothetical protein
MTGFGVRVERLHCPIGSCAWTYEREFPPQTTHTLPAGQSPLHDGLATTLQEALADAVYATLLADALETEGVVRAHLETHDLLDWVREVMRLRGLFKSQQEPVACTCAPGSLAPHTTECAITAAWPRPMQCACGDGTGAAHPHPTWFNSSPRVLSSWPAPDGRSAEIRP